MSADKIIPIAIGILLMFLGCSFAFKFVRATVLGKLDYWAGFLPISILSPLFVHTTAPPKVTMQGKKGASPQPVKRSMIKEVSGLWVHVLVGPFFLVLSVLFLAAGGDLAGLPGTETLNLVLNGFNNSGPIAVTYDKRYTFRFPFLVRALKRFGRRMDTAQIPLPANQRLLDTPEIRAEETRRQNEANRSD